MPIGYGLALVQPLRVQAASTVRKSGQGHPTSLRHIARQCLYHGTMHEIELPTHRPEIWAGLLTKGITY